MLLFTVAQIAASIAATYFSAGVAMAAGRDLGARVPPSRRLLGPRGRSLRRPVADHPQHQRRAKVQILLHMTFTMLVAVPIQAIGGIVMAMRQGPSCRGCCSSACRHW